MTKISLLGFYIYHFGIFWYSLDPLTKYLPPESQHSCRYWIHHLKQSQASSSEIEDVRLFLQKHFLHWVEAMSLLGLVSEVVGMLDALHTVIPVSNIVDSHL